MSAACGVVFVVLAGAAATVAALSAAWPLRVVGAAGASSFLLIAVAYFGAGPRLLLKRADGRRHPAGWLVHWPYFLLTAVSYRLTVLCYREAAYVEIAPNVFLGRRLTAREARRADLPVWAAVLDLAAELPEPRPLRDLENYRSLPVLDATAMSGARLADAVEWVRAHAIRGPVYIHCALGHSRSATVAAAYLLAVGLAADPKTALTRLRRLRPGVRLNRAQWRALKQFAKSRGVPESPLNG